MIDLACLIFFSVSYTVSDIRSHCRKTHNYLELNLVDIFCVLKYEKRESEIAALPFGRMQQICLPSSRLCRRENSNIHRCSTGKHLGSLHSRNSGKNRKQGTHLEASSENPASRIIKLPSVPVNPIKNATLETPFNLHRLNQLLSRGFLLVELRRQPSRHFLPKRCIRASCFCLNESSGPQKRY